MCVCLRVCACMCLCSCSRVYACFCVVFAFAAVFVFFQAVEDSMSKLPKKRKGRGERSYEGVSTQHNPEFTMLELYQAYADYEDFMVLIEDMMSEISVGIHKSESIIYQEKEINFLFPIWSSV